MIQDLIKETIEIMGGKHIVDNDFLVADVTVSLRYEKNKMKVSMISFDRELKTYNILKEEDAVDFIVAACHRLNSRNNKKTGHINIDK